MLDVIARAIAYVLLPFALLRPFFRNGVTRGLTFVIGFGAAAALFGGHFTPQASFITADGSTATTWKSGGAAGNGAFRGTSLDSPAAGTVAIGGTNAANVDLGSASAGNNVNLDGNNISIGDANNTFNAQINATGRIHIGDSTSDPELFLGDQGAGASQSIELGGGGSELDINAATIFCGSTASLSGPWTFSSGLTSNGGTTIGGTSEFNGNYPVFDYGIALSNPLLGGPASVACGTGGTFTVPGFAGGGSTSGIIVSSGTLTSNCILDISAGASILDRFVVFDMRAVTLGATFGVQFTNGTTSSAVYTSSSVRGGNLAIVWSYNPGPLVAQW